MNTIFDIYPLAIGTRVSTNMLGGPVLGTVVGYTSGYGSQVGTRYGIYGILIDGGSNRTISRNREELTLL